MKYIVLVASIIIQACLGGLYAWSGFAPALTDAYGLTASQTQLIFGVLIAVFALSMVFAGRLLRRLGPRLTALAGGLFFGAGYLIAALSGGAFPLLLLGIGVAAGLGTGFGYVCPLTVLMQWFPAHKGLVTGVAVAGFGGGAVILTSLTEALLAGGLDVLAVFGLIGAVYGAAVTLASLALSVPRRQEDVPAPSTPASSALRRDPFFISLAVAMFCGTFAGLLVIGNLKPMALSTGVSSSQAAAAVSVFAAGNTMGRVAWGWLADKLGRRAVPVSLIFLAVAVILLAFFSGNAASLIVVSLFVGFGFGACFVVYAAQVAFRYGAERVGTVYPLVFLAYGAAGLAGPFTGGWLFDATSGYTASLSVSVAVVTAGLVISGLLTRAAKASGRPRP